MDRIKETCFQILLEIDKVCKASGLQYYIYAGTLLGAVRHNGFIPWDDDIDIVMFRRDYDMFPDACRKYLDHNKYELQTIYSDPLTSNPWMKLHDKNTAFISGIRRPGTMEGINIDIFPVDNAPDSMLIQKWRGKYFDTMNYIYQWRFVNHNKNASWKMRVFQNMISLIPPYDEMRFKKRYDKKIKNLNNKKTQNVVYFSNRKYTRKIINRSCFEDVEMLQFENRMFPAPKGWHEVLMGLYGKDYMQMPPEEKRVTVHGTVVVDLDNSWRCYKKGIGEYEKI